MMASKDFEFIFNGRNVDVTNVAEARRVVIDQVNDPAFATLIGNLQVMAQNAVAGPAPRGGEAGVSCRADGRGNTSCEGHLTLRWG